MSASIILHLVVLHLSTFGWVFGVRIGTESSDAPAALNIEYGFVPDGEEPTFVAARARVFAFREDVDYRVQLGGGQLTSEMVISHDVERHSGGIAATLGLSASGRYGVAAFSGAISASTRRSGSSSVRTMRADSLMRSRKKIVRLMGPIINLSRLRQKLARGVEEAFNTLSPEQIYNYFGAFRATRIELGGVLRTSVFRELRRSDHTNAVQTSMRAAMRTFTVSASASASGSRTDAASQSSGATHTKILVQGGNVDLWFGASASAGFGDIQRRWAASFHDGNLAVTKLSLEPLSNIIRHVNQAKALAFDRYCSNRWGQEVRAVAQSQALLAYAAEPAASLRMLLGQRVRIENVANQRRLYCMPHTDPLNDRTTHLVGAMPSGFGQEFIISYAEVWNNRGGQDGRYVTDHNLYFITGAHNDNGYPARRLQATSDGSLGAVDEESAWARSDTNRWEIESQADGSFVIKDHYQQRRLFAREGQWAEHLGVVRGFGAPYDDQKWRIERW